LRFYGLDLRLEVQSSSVRRLVALIQGLPGDSALAAANAAEQQEEPANVIRSGAELAGWLNENASKA
jgi:hypothetical protein